MKTDESRNMFYPSGCSCRENVNLSKSLVPNEEKERAEKKMYSTTITHPEQNKTLTQHNMTRVETTHYRTELLFVKINTEEKCTPINQKK